MRSSICAPGDAEAELVCRILWTLCALTWALAVCAATAARLRFADVEGFASEFCAYLSVLLVARVYAQRRGLDDIRLRLCIDLALTFGLNALGDVVLQYAAATVAAPDVTAYVQATDHALGFDWFGYAHFVGGVAPLSQTLKYCYAYWMGGMVAAMGALALTRRFAAIGEFAIAFTLTSLAITGVFALIDGHSLEAAAAYAIPGLHHPIGTSPRVLEALIALRSGAARTLNFREIWPMVSFPSLHGATALLLAAATRGLGRLRYPFLVFNVLVFVSTISEGGHNVTDIVAGAVVAFTAILAAGPIYRALEAPAPHVRDAVPAALPTI